MNLAELQKKARLQAIHELKIEYQDRLDYVKILQAKEKELKENKN